MKRGYTWGSPPNAHHAENYYLSMIADTAKDLRGIALAASDASAYFAALYARVTTRIGESIVAGQFALRRNRSNSSLRCRMP